MLLFSAEESQTSLLFLQLSRLPPTQGRQNVPEQVYFIHLIATICECQPSLICRSEYDRGPNTFSPEGRLFQVMIIIPGFEQLTLKSVCKVPDPKEILTLARFSFRFNTYVILTL